MKNRITVIYLVNTFLISYVLWGMIIIANQFGYLRFGNPVCIILWILGAFGPTASSYIVQKKIGRITGFKDFIKKTFHLKASVISYVLVILFMILYFFYPAIRGEITLGIPIYQSVLTIPFMLFGGGMEEVGWRWVLQPELEKKLPFTVATIITAMIWTLWHLPLFFIPGTSQSNTNIWAFFILVIGVSFMLATIYDFGKNIWLCVLAHCALNALPATFEFEQNLPVNTGISIVLIVSALIMRQILAKKSVHVKNIS